MKQIDLSNVHACQSEMQDCSRGLAYLDHIFGRAVDALSEAESTWDSVESDAAAKVREDAPKAATATEIKGAITAYVNARPPAREARDELTKARDRMAKVDRWMRSLEKRLSAAQSAQNGHQALGKYGGAG